MDCVLIVSEKKCLEYETQLLKSGVKKFFYTEDFSQIDSATLKNVDTVLIPVETAKNNQKELQKLKEQNQKLQNKLEETRLVNRAKCVLIQYLNMTEQQAHRYIEKQSMDLRQSRVVTAESILKTYES